MPTFVYMTRCDGCVDIASTSARPISCTSIKPIVVLTILNPICAGSATRALKPVRHHAIDVRGYADFTPLGSSVRVIREEEKGTIAWRIKFRNGTEKNFLSPITTKPWGKYIPQLADVAPPSQEMRDSELLYNEPKYLRLDEGDLNTLESNGLTLKEGVYY